MGYANIENLYKVAPDILIFSEVFALEKIHGTSCKVRWNDGAVTFSPGGCSHKHFESLFDPIVLAHMFEEIGHPQVVVYGEGYGAKMQGMSATYGKALRFVAFEVRIGEHWLAVPQAEAVCQKLGLEFVSYVKIPATVACMDAERDKPSVQAVRNGIDEPMPREGIVIRPLIELTKNNGERIIAKHKVELHHERKNQPGADVDPEKLKVLTEAAEVADEWVVPRRLEHVLQAFPDDVGMEITLGVIEAMVADVYKEAKGEIVESVPVAKAIGRKTAELLKAHCQERMHNSFPGTNPQ